MHRTFLCLCAAAMAAGSVSSAAVVAVTDGINYNVGSVVRIRATGGGTIHAAIRYAGEDKPVFGCVLLAYCLRNPLMLFRIRLGQQANGGVVWRDSQCARPP